MVSTPINDDERQEAADFAMDVLLGNNAKVGGLTTIQFKILRALRAGKADARFWIAMRELHPKLDSKTLPVMVARRLLYWHPADPLQGTAERMSLRPRGLETLIKCEREARKAIALRKGHYVPRAGPTQR